MNNFNLKMLEMQFRLSALQKCCARWKRVIFVCFNSWRALMEIGRLLFSQLETNRYLFKSRFSNRPRTENFSGIYFRCKFHSLLCCRLFPAAFCSLHWKSDNCSFFWGSSNTYDRHSFDPKPLQKLISNAGRIFVAF